MKIKVIKFTQEDIHGKFFSDSLDQLYLEYSEKIKSDFLCAIIAKRLAKYIQASENPSKIHKFCVEILEKEFHASKTS